MGFNGLYIGAAAMLVCALIVFVVGTIIKKKK